MLETMIDKFRNRPVGINALAAALGEDKDTIEAMYEPYLLKIGFIQRTPTGRALSPMTLKMVNVIIVICFLIININITPPPSPLLEILIVMGVVGTLATIAILVLNPTELSNKPKEQYS